MSRGREAAASDGSARPSSVEAQDRPRRTKALARRRRRDKLAYGEGFVDAMSQQVEMRTNRDGDKDQDVDNALFTRPVSRPPGLERAEDQDVAYEQYIRALSHQSVTEV